MSLVIPETYITDLKEFTWEKDWRATRIIKEKRVSGDYYFAHIVRYYGEKEDTDDYDIGETLRETAWLGRTEKFVGKRGWRVDPTDQTRRKRMYTEPVTEDIDVDDGQGNITKRKVLRKGKTIYEYTLPVTKENTDKLKRLAGAIALNQETQFLFIYGANPPHAVDPETFWDTTMNEYLQNISNMKQVMEAKSNGKKA